MPAQLLFSHRGVLALQAGAVEAQCSDAGWAAWDVEKALVPSLTRLWLWQVPCGQGDGLHHTHWHIDVGRWQDLWAVLRTAKHWLSWSDGSKRCKFHCSPGYGDSQSPGSRCHSAYRHRKDSGLQVVLQPGCGCIGLAFYSCYILGPHY